MTRAGTAANSAQPSSSESFCTARTDVDRFYKSETLSSIWIGGLLLWDGHLFDQKGEVGLTQHDLDALCLDIYRETASSGPIADLCKGAPRSYGFEILMGPPFKHAEIAFIGYQPGDWELSIEQAREKGFESSWVTADCHYHVQQWRLARILRGMFGAVLQRCVGLNAVFVRSSNVSSYEASVPASTRSAIAEYSLAKVKTILEAIQPRRIVVIGFATMDLFGPSDVVLAEGERRLLKAGFVFGRPTFITPHLAGARGYTNEHRRKMAEFILK